MANEKKVYKQVVTPKGEALFAHLDKPEVYEGNEIGYTITLKLPEKETKDLIAKIDAELEKAKEEMVLKAGQKWSAEPFCGYREDNRGDIIFKFKAAAHIKLKTGEMVERNVPVFDALGHKMDDKAIGNGSIIRVAFQMIPFWVSKAVNGVSLRLVAVQVIEKKDYAGKSADEYGFEVEEGGYNVQDDAPFYDSTEEDGSDF
jgi:hypothetical protein